MLWFMRAFISRFFRSSFPSDSARSDGDCWNLENPDCFLGSSGSIKWFDSLSREIFSSFRYSSLKFLDSAMEFVWLLRIEEGVCLEFLEWFRIDRSFS